MNDVIRVLLIEDDPNDVVLVREALRHSKYDRFQLNTANRLEDGLQLLEREDIDVILLDLSLPDSSMLNGMIAIQSSHHNIPIVVLTGLGDEEVALQALRLGAQDYLLKGNNIFDLLQRTIKFAIERFHLLSEIEQGRRMLEQRVYDRTKQLESVNKELESFCYSVSHDLRSPIRTINGFCQALIEDYFEQLGNDGRDYLKRIQMATLRMDSLIQNLLRLSRLSRGEISQESIDLSAMVGDIAGELEQNHPEHHVTCIIEPQVYGDGDANLMRIVLENLLVNAWKFTSKTTNPHIEFGMTQAGQQPVYHVTDNGAGFDMAYADQLFGTFQRLHSANEFPGTGIGLATVQRIIHRHNGRIWAEGAVNHGATFYFTLHDAAELDSTDAFGKGE
ncbi:MAG: ATP-binding protein [bacterium]